MKAELKLPGTNELDFSFLSNPRSHSLRGNARLDALRHVWGNLDAERPGVRSHA